MNAKASSQYDAELVEKRLAELRSGQQTAETKREIKYLEELKRRKGWA